MGYSRLVRYLHGSSLRLWSQDLTTDISRLRGGIVRHGRASVTRWYDSTNPRDESDVREGGKVGAEWGVAMPTATGMYYRFDPSGDNRHSLHWALYKVWSVWLHWDPPFVPVEKRTGRALRRWEAKDFSEKEIGWAFHGGTLFWTVWKDPSHWSRSDGWRHSSVNFVNWVLGKTIYSEDDLSTTQTVVAMPEATYPVEVTLQRARWSRPRGFFGIGEKEIRRAQVDVLDANGDKSSIPVPGKGENSWDCGEDGTWSVALPAATVPEALAGLIESVLRTRERHGGSVNWRPSSPRALP